MFDHKQHRKNQALDAAAKDTFDRMAEVLPEGKQGVASVDHFTMSHADVMASLHAYDEDFLHEGTYARLRVNGQVMMSDSPMEMRTNLEVVKRAKGRVLIAGMGIGMILRAILRKSEVTHVTVLEKYQDVVDLVLPSLANGLMISGYRAAGDGSACTAPPSRGDAPRRSSARCRSRSCGI